MVTIHTTCCDTKVCAQRQSAFPCYHHANSKHPHTASTDWTPRWIRTVFSLRYDSVYRISKKSSRHCRAASQAVGRRVLTAEAPDGSQGTAYEICDGRSGNAGRVSLKTSACSYQYHSTSDSYASSYPCCPYQKDKWERPGNLTKTNTLSEIGAHWYKVLSIYSLHFGYSRCLCQHQSTNPPSASSSSKQHWQKHERMKREDLPLMW